MKRTINIWMQMLGFEKNDADRGVARFLDRTEFVPDSVCGLLFHADFVHLHRGMEEEYVLFPDNCAYRAVLRNTERFRQEWTNFELRELVAELKKKGIKYYAGIMGCYLKDRYHKEWITDHPELFTCRISNPKKDLMCLKRFADGSYYEDFFTEKLVRTLVDYDMAGVHLSDVFCPSSSVYKSDYSTDMVEQFIDHTGIELPRKILDTLGDDSLETAELRQAYIWGEKREEWISFYEWRWARFFKKVCDAVHAVGKEVWVLGMYCTDPFETEYIYGIDLKKIMDAGVDCITANILPTSVAAEKPIFPYFFHRMHMDLPILRTFVGDRKILSMVSIHDASEEWSMIDHCPVRVEKDIYTTTAFAAKDEKGAVPGCDGVFLCLGDGVENDKWRFIKKRLDIGLGTDVVRSYSPLVLWSDSAHNKMLGEYIKTRRTTPHKQSFEIFKAGVPFGGAVRSEYTDICEEVLFVPNFDMISDEERAALAEYKYPWVATAPVDYPLDGVSVGAVFSDRYSDYPMKVFTHGFDVESEIVSKIEDMLSKDDGKASEGDQPERDFWPLTNEIAFRKLSDGFIGACCELLSAAMYLIYPVKCTNPMMVQKLTDGSERLYIYNRYDRNYAIALVESELPIESAEVASAFPVLPVKFVDEEETTGYFDYGRASATRKCFQIKLAIDGVTVVDIKRKD